MAHHGSLSGHLLLTVVACLGVLLYSVINNRNMIKYIIILIIISVWACSVLTSIVFLWRIPLACGVWRVACGVWRVACGVFVAGRRTTTLGPTLRTTTTAM